MKKLIWVIMTLIVLVILYLSLIGVNQEIMEEHPSIQFDSKNDSGVTGASITIKGTLTKRFFMKDKFKGTLEINGYDWKYSGTSLAIDNPNGYYGGISADVSLSESLTSADWVASFRAKKDFTRLQINLVDSDIKIIAPATSLEEAKVIEQELKSIY